ncbi:MAG: flagellar protein FlaG [Spirochaetales bacterium]|jgi:flagellar protein FlaG|nr:flagellar protein FlaG [Spirochaetales bacterium]
MDVNVTTDVKSYGAPSVSSMEIEDVKKPQVTPVVEAKEGVSARLNDEALHGKQQPGGKGQELSSEDLEKAIGEIQTRLDSMGSKLNFGLSQHAETNDIVIQITDKTNGELVKQFPSEAVLQLQEKLNDLVGLLFDKQV